MYSKYVKKIDSKGNLKAHPRTMTKKKKSDGLARVDQPVKRQMEGDDRGTDPQSKRNKQLEEDMKKALR